MRLPILLSGLLLSSVAPLPAQSARWEDTLPPRAFARLAMQARAADSVPARAAAWSAWAQAAPDSTAPRLALATLARYDVRYGDAMQWLDSAARVATTPLWRNAIARERISVQLTRGEFVGMQAMVAGIMADSAALPPGEWAEARFSRLSADRRRGLPVGLAAVDSVAALALPTDSSLQARLHCTRAAYDTKRLLEHASRGIAIATLAHLPFVVANCALIVGATLSQLAETEQALAWLQRSEDLARAAHDLPTLAAGLQWYGSTLSSVTFIQKARLKLVESIRIAQRIEGRNVEAWALVALASASQQVGDFSSTSLALRRAAILFEATGDSYGAQYQRIEEIASLLMLKDRDGAERVAAGVLSYGRTVRNPVLEMTGAFELGNVAMHRGQYARARQWLDTAAVRVDSLGERYRSRLNWYRGIVAWRSGAPADAVRLLREVRTHYEASQNLALLRVTGPLSSALLLAGDTTAAAGMLVTASDDLDAVRGSISDGGFRKVLTLPDAWGASEGAQDEVMAGIVPSRRWLPTVFAVAERARSRALLKGAFGSVSADSTLGDAERRVRATSTDLAKVQRSLAPGTALLVYAGGANAARTSVMVITRTSARGLTIASLDSLDRDIVRWLALLESGETGAGAGRRAAASVLSTALRGLPASITRLVVVPQGPLYRVPFHALPLGSGVLGDRVVVTVAPSVSLAMAYAADPRRAIPANVLALGAGDTNIESDTPGSLAAATDGGKRSDFLAPLRAAADEARAAAAWGSGSLALTGPAASESALKREARDGRFTVLHAAAHALTSDQVLGANWLILRADSTEDGYVSGGELAQLASGLSLVVLSGCRTTGDFGSRGDAIDGLVAPLLARGVRTVVASHWAVSDRWTRVLMERFYANLAAGLGTADALHRAQASLRTSGVPARFWAAFSVIGDGALTLGSARRDDR